MSLIFNGTTVNKIIYNGVEIKDLYYNNTKVFSGKELTINSRVGESGYAEYTNYVGTPSYLVNFDNGIGSGINERKISPYISFSKPLNISKYVVEFRCSDPTSLGEDISEFKGQSNLDIILNGCDSYSFGGDVMRITSYDEEGNLTGYSTCSLKNSKLSTLKQYIYDSSSYARKVEFSLIPNGTSTGMSFVIPTNIPANILGKIYACVDLSSIDYEENIDYMNN